MLHSPSRTILPAAVALLAATVLLLGACGRSQPRPTVLFIGLDGATWDVASPMIARGELPHLKALIDRGFAAPLGTFMPSLSPIIWTSIASGKTMQKHGITGFVARRADGSEEPVLSNARRVRAFWDIFSERDVRVGIVGWWLTWPAELVNGFMVSSLSVLEAGLWKGSAYVGLPKQVHPAAWSPDLDEVVKREQERAAETSKALFADLDAAFGNEIQKRVIRDTKSALLSDQIFFESAKRYWARDRTSFCAVYSGIIDVASHRMWKYFRPDDKDFETSEQDVAALGDVIPRSYRWVDARIGELVEQAGPDAIVIVASDHGFHAETRPSMHEDERSGGHEFANLPGILVAAGPGIRKADLRAGVPTDLPTVFDLAPTLLHLYGLPRAQDMDGRVYVGLFEPSFLEQRPLAEEIPTYETSPRSTISVSPGDLDTVDKAKDGVMQRLQSLGYLEDGK